MTRRVCRVSGCDQVIYLRPDVRDTCEACRIRLGLPPHPVDPKPLPTTAEPIATEDSRR